MGIRTLTSILLAGALALGNADGSIPSHKYETLKYLDLSKSEFKSSSAKLRYFIDENENGKIDRDEKEIIPKDFTIGNNVMLRVEIKPSAYTGKRICVLYKDITRHKILAFPPGPLINVNLDEFKPFMTFDPRMPQQDPRIKSPLTTGSYSLDLGYIEDGEFQTIDRLPFKIFWQGTQQELDCR